MNIKLSLKPVSAFLRKYSTLLPSATIALAALLLFVPMYLIGGSVKKSMATTSLNMARQVQSELSDVPTRDKAQQVKYYMDKLEEDASNIEKLALESCKRDLITYEDVIFPKPVDSSAQVFHEFGLNFRASIEEMLKRIRALDAPTDTEIRAKTDGAARAGGLGARPAFQGMQTVNTADPVIDALCVSRAKEISVYAHPSAFTWYTFWEKYEFAGENQALQDCWDTQVAYWIYQDIIETVYKMNGTSSTVDESAVKRLLGASFSGPVAVARGTSMYAMEFSRGQMSMGGRDIPNYITPRLYSNFVTDSPTGRKCDEEVDVIHFTAAVVVDNRFVLAFLKELCSEKSHSYRTDFSASGEVVQNARHNQITVLQSDLKVVDPQAPEHKLYRYGNGAVVQLDVICEYQFYRKSYDSIKPEPIQKRLDLTQTETGVPGGMPPAPMGAFGS